MDYPLISIVVPVYNSSAYLNQCLNSLIGQTYKNIEIIIINDGSTDNSKEIVESFLNKDNRIVLKTINNSGVSNARNVGLNLAHGEYLSFVDSDDYVAENYIEKLFFAVRTCGSDISTCHAVDFYNDGQTTVTSKQNIVQTVPYINYSFLAPYSHYVCWGALYKNAIVDSLSFSADYKVAEDTMFFAQALKNSGSVTDIPDCLYFYRIQDNSLSKGSYGPNQFCEVKAWDEIVQLFDNQSLKCRFDCKASRSFRALKGIHLSVKYNGLDDPINKPLLQFVRKELCPALFSSLSLKHKIQLAVVALLPSTYMKLYYLLRVQS